MRTLDGRISGLCARRHVRRGDLRNGRLSGRGPAPVPAVPEAQNQGLLLLHARVLQKQLERAQERAQEAGRPSGLQSVAVLLVHRYLYSGQPSYRAL